MHSHLITAKRWLLSFSLLITCMSTSHADVYKNFENYTDIQFIPELAGDCSSTALRCHYSAKEKINDRGSDVLYEDNKWHLLLRHSLYQAQVEKAMSEIYLYFMGYATDIDIVKKDDEYFVASRSFKNFISWNRFESDSLTNNYTFQQDGTLLKGNQKESFIGLGQISALAYFFADADVTNSENYGIQEINNVVRCIKIDNADALEDLFEKDTPTIDSELQQSNFGKNILSLKSYQDEKHNMLIKIANTNFTIIENILRKNITTTSLEMARWYLGRRLQSPDQEIRADALADLDKLNNIDPKEYALDKTIDKLKQRHQKLRIQLGLEQSKTR